MREMQLKSCTDHHCRNTFLTFSDHQKQPEKVEDANKAREVENVDNCLAYFSLFGSRLNLANQHFGRAKHELGQNKS